MGLEQQIPLPVAVASIASGSSRQLLQTNTAGTGVEWTDDVDIPGTLDVTGVATFDNQVRMLNNVSFAIEDSAGSLKSTIRWEPDDTLSIDPGNNTVSVNIKAGSAVVDSNGLRLSSGVVALDETTTPSAVTGVGKVYTKADNNLYFQDGAGTEHTIAFV